MKRRFAAALVAALVILLTGCPTTLLHNVPEVYLVVAVENWPDDGEYAVPGINGEWTYTLNPMTVASGSGQTDPIRLTTGEQLFSVTTNGEWSRPWYPATAGNSEDGFTPGSFWNFEIDLELTAAGTITLTIDGSADEATWSQSFVAQ